MLCLSCCARTVRYCGASPNLSSSVLFVNASSAALMNDGARGNAPENANAVTGHHYTTPDLIPVDPVFPIANITVAPKGVLVGDVIVLRSSGVLNVAGEVSSAFQTYGDEFCPSRERRRQLYLAGAASSLSSVVTAPAETVASRAVSSPRSPTLSYGGTPTWPPNNTDPMTFCSGAGFGPSASVLSLIHI